MFEAERKETDTGIEYYEVLPEGYIKLTNFKELFNISDGTNVMTIENAVPRKGLELMIFNPVTREYYPRILYYAFDRIKYLDYIKDGNLYIKETDLIYGRKMV